MKFKLFLPVVFIVHWQGRNLLFILGRKCILVVVAFIIKSSMPGNSAIFYPWFNRMLSSLFKIRSAEHRHAVNIALSHHNYSKVSPVHKCILMRLQSSLPQSAAQYVQNHSIQISKWHTDSFTCVICSKVLFYENKLCRLLFFSTDTVSMFFTVI